MLYIHWKLVSMKNIFTITGSIGSGLAVVLGAFAAHSLKSILTDDSLRIFHTGVEYQFYHSLALIITGMLLKHSSRMANVAGYLFLSGIILFSGSLYLLAFATTLHAAGIVTPIGGLCFVAGWIFLTISFTKADKKIPSV